MVCSVYSVADRLLKIYHPVYLLSSFSEAGSLGTRQLPFLFQLF